MSSRGQCNDDPPTSTDVASARYLGICHALSLLALELPDPKNELFFQPLQEFTLFPRLPLEIRRMIWRETFPARRRVYRQPDYTSPYPKTTIKGLSPPISAHVNHESRHETLQHYQVVSLSQPPLAYARSSHRRREIRLSTYWNKEKDALILSFDRIVDGNYFFFSLVDIIYPSHTCIRGIRILELNFTSCWQNHLRQKMELLGDLEEVLEAFVELEELRLIYCRPDIYSDGVLTELSSAPSHDNMVKMLTDFFKCLANRDQSRNTPDIMVVEAWKK